MTLCQRYLRVYRVAGQYRIAEWVEGTEPKDCLILNHGEAVCVAVRREMGLWPYEGVKVKKYMLLGKGFRSECSQT